MTAKRRRRRKKKTRASILYAVTVAALLIVVAFLALSLHELFAPSASREGPVTVLVLNGCGVEGIGLRTARELRSLGLDVIDFRNADSFDYAETIVIDRTGDLRGAADVARLLGVTNVVQQVPETPLVDVIVVVGKDHEKYVKG